MTFFTLFMEISLLVPPPYIQMQNPHNTLECICEIEIKLFLKYEVEDQENFSLISLDNGISLSRSHIRIQKNT